MVKRLRSVRITRVAGAVLLQPICLLHSGQLLVAMHLMNNVFHDGLENLDCHVLSKQGLIYCVLTSIKIHLHIVFKTKDLMWLLDPTHIARRTSHYSKLGRSIAVKKAVAKRGGG